MKPINMKLLNKAFCLNAFLTANLLALPLANAGSLINPEALSFFEEPIAVEIGDTTFVLAGVVDIPVTVDLEGDDEEDINFIGDIELSAETQLSNRWTVGMSYFGEYIANPEEATITQIKPTSDTFSRNMRPLRGRALSRVIGGQVKDMRSNKRRLRLGAERSQERRPEMMVEPVPEEKYEDNIAAFISGSSGGIVLGNVSGLASSDTQRESGIGNAQLSFDNNYGSLSEWSAGYVGRFGPVNVILIRDTEDNSDIGFTFQRPIGNKDYRLSTRLTDSEFTSSDGSELFDSVSIITTGELVYGSSIVGLSLGYEDISSDGYSTERWYTSAGLSTKVGVLRLSLEGHYGAIEDQTEKSAALGVQYDVSRGLSLNFGLNYADADIEINGADYTQADDVTAISSLRYGF